MKTIQSIIPVGLLLTAISPLCEARQEPRSINIHNNSKSKVEIYWVHPQTGETILQSNPFIYSGATFSLNSFVSHAFEAREIPGKSGKCAGEDQTCRVGHFAVNANDEQGTSISMLIFMNM